MTNTTEMTHAEHKAAREEAFAARHSLRKGDEPSASELAYRLSALLRVCCMAKDNDNGPLFKDWDGLAKTLELAESWAGDLIEAVEYLEMDTEKGGAS